MQLNACSRVTDDNELAIVYQLVIPMLGNNTKGKLNRFAHANAAM